MAVHEAGHALANIVLKLGTITTVTIDGLGGNGYVEGDMPDAQAQTEELAKALLVSKLAGRAAEIEVLGCVTAGSGGSPNSDLAHATELALSMETSLGFGSEWPLLYRPAGDRSSLLIYNPLMAERISARLEEAYAIARQLIRQNRRAIDLLARTLVDHDTLEGPELAAVIARIENLRAALPAQG